MARTGRKRVNWGAIGAIAGVAGALFAYLSLRNTPENVASGQGHVAGPGSTVVPPAPATPVRDQNTQRERTPFQPARGSSDSSSGYAGPSGIRPRNVGATSIGTTVPPSRREAQRVITIGPVSTTNQQGGINAGYIENNNSPPR
jgi:hypothetical protein